MDKEQVDKWRKVQIALEKAGKTDSFFYKRALAVVTTGRDPGDSLNFSDFSKS
jgi:hypothetical protein